MRESRALGFYVEYLFGMHGVPEDKFCEITGCTSIQRDRFFNGRLLLSYKQIQNIADFFGMTVKELLDNNEALYEDYCEKQYGTFSGKENRERVLDIIDGYLDVVESVDKG